MIRLYRAHWSTNAERVALALAHKGLEVESVLIDYSDRSPVEEVSGQGLVPVIVDEDGTVVSDSRRILRYLEERYPDPPLWPSEPRDRTWLELLFEWFDEVWKVAPNAIEGETDDAEVERLAAVMDRHLDDFERLLDGREYLLGDFGAVDCLVFPFLKYARGREDGDDEEFHVILDERQSLEGRPNLAAWIERVDARPRAY